MKVVDTGGGFVHMVEVTAINFHDVIVAAKLLWQDDGGGYGDSKYLGLANRVIEKLDFIWTMQYTVKTPNGCLCLRCLKRSKPGHPCTDPSRLLR